MIFIQIVYLIKPILVNSIFLLLNREVITIFFNDFIFMHSLCLNLYLIEIKRLFNGIKN